MRKQSPTETNNSLDLFKLVEIDTNGLENIKGGEENDNNSIVHEDIIDH